MQCVLILNVVVGERTAVLQLPASEDESLCIGRYSFLLSDHSLDVSDRVPRLNIQGDRTATQGLDEDLHGFGGASLF